MKKLTIDEWEKHYVAEPIQQMDQINTVTRRVFADKEYKGRLERLLNPITYLDKPGFYQHEYALRWTPRYLHAKFAELNDSKVNPSPLAATLNKIIQESRGALSYVPGNVEDKYQATSEAATSLVKRVAKFYGADLVGIAPLEKRWIYSYTTEKTEGGASYDHVKQEIPEDVKYAVVMGFAPDYDLLKYPRTYIGGAGHDEASTRMVVTSQTLTLFLQNLGFKAIDCNLDDVVMSVPLAMLAGMGQLGRHGMLITPQYGPRIRLGVVLTSLPLETDAPIDFGVTEFCEVCKRCAEMCPSDSIPSGRRNTEPVNVSNSPGGIKWYHNGETCRILHVTARYPCATCNSVCPYNKPDTLFHRTARWLTDNARWGDRFYSWIDKSLGYGEIKKPDSFWKEWNPESRRR
jgi:reductive dehalogenase